MMMAAHAVGVIVSMVMVVIVGVGHG